MGSTMELLTPTGARVDASDIHNHNYAILAVGKGGKGSACTEVVLWLRDLTMEYLGRGYGRRCG
jgi:hypothetical protein